MSEPAPQRSASGPLAILHILDRFDGATARDERIIRLMNHWGGKARHDVLLSDRSANDARLLVDPTVPLRFLAGPPFGAAGGPGRFVALAQVMRGYDLVLSYSWGGIDGPMTQRLLGLLMGLPPLIHHEDGSGLDETGPLGFGSDFYRKLASGAPHAVVVPSVQLAHVAIDRWNTPPKRVKQIPDGIETHAFAPPRGPARDKSIEIPGVEADDRLLVGARISDASPQQVDALLKAVAPLSDRIRLMLLDAPGEQQPLTERARVDGLDTLLVPDTLPAPVDYLRALDIFVVLSPDDSCPRCVVEAMAAGLPVIAADTGDVSAMLASANRALLVKPGKEEALTAALARLAGDEELRRGLGSANRRRAAQCFDEKVMLDLYSRLYGEAAGRSEALL